MTTTNEPRALTAALSSPAFVTRGGGLAMHVANRHVSRWAPEVGEPGANRIRSLRSLGFVDRLVSPWIESAQRSASLRMFSQYISNGIGERQTNSVSWVFPRPWYQDELDWMAAARAVGTQTAVEQAAAPQMFTTRGTYVAPVQSQLALPSALYEYVAPSLSVARPSTHDAPTVSDAYSPLVPLAATHAAQVMARALAPMMTAARDASGGAATRMSPGLRAVLATMLERSALAPQAAMEPSRISSYAPELVTPPAPRAESPAGSESYETTQATQVAEQYAEQRARVGELQRVARAAAEREYVAREAAREAARTPDAGRVPDARIAEVRAAEARAIEQRQAELQRRATELTTQRTAERATGEAARREGERATADAERQRIEARIAQRIAERTGQQEAQRLHAQSRDAAARDARMASSAADAAQSAPEVLRAAPVESRVATEIAAAIAALPPELQSMVAAGISGRPDRAVQAIAELGDALRAVELIARNTAAGGTVEATRGPRLVMPTGLGGLVATVERTTGERAPVRRPVGVPSGMAAQQATRRELRVPAMAFLSAPNAPSMGSAAPSPTTALGAATASQPAALAHVAWSDRWLARFAGAKPQTLDLLAATSASSEMRLEMLAAAAPGTVFVAPFFDESRAMPADSSRASEANEPLPTLRNAAHVPSAARFDDDAETPDDVFTAIAAAATRTRAGAASSAAAAATPPPAATLAAYERETLADLVAHAAPSAPGAGLSAQLASSPFAPALRHVLPLGTAPTFDVRSLFGGGLGATYLAGLLAASTDELTVAAPSAWAPAFEADGELPVRDISGFEPTYVAPELPRVPSDDSELVETSAIVAAHAPLTTLRSALLSWDVDTFVSQPGGPIETRASTPSLASTTLARSIVDGMALPILGDAAALGDIGVFDVGGMPVQASSYAAPGMIADRAQTWSVAQERSTSDLAFDFVSPELVLAARVYGLGPAEAAQAGRLAIGGPGQLTAMAGAVDRTFVQALAIESERRGERGRALTTAFPLTTPDAPYAPPGVAGAAEAPSFVPTPASSTFGVERRAPRGAFLWPAATTAALGLSAASPDGELSMSVAALELLAAQAVAELGTYAALGERSAFAGGESAATGGASLQATGMGSEPGEADVLASAEAMVPAARRDKFQALYLALGQSPSGRSWSPAARAARALALAGRGEDAMSARERASVVWDVLPMVYGLPEEGETTLSTGDAAARATRRREELRALDPVFVDGRPGLGALSARAGEALGSYVAPSASSTSSSPASGASASASRSEVGAVLRAPTAAQELVQTGRPSGRHGGGEVEIPPWFEAAARKMLEDRSSVSEGISIAELTLVQAAAPQQLAASSRGDAGSTAPIAPAPSAAVGAEKDKIDIEKLANDVYREILVLMDIARARNGEPYL